MAKAQPKKNARSGKRPANDPKNKPPESLSSPSPAPSMRTIDQFFFGSPNPQSLQPVDLKEGMGSQHNREPAADPKRQTISHAKGKTPFKTPVKMKQCPQVLLTSDITKYFDKATRIIDRSPALEDAGMLAQTTGHTVSTETGSQSPRRESANSSTSSHLRFRHHLNPTTPTRASKVTSTSRKAPHRAQSRRIVGPGSQTDIARYLAKVEPTPSLALGFPVNFTGKSPGGQDNDPTSPHVVCIAEDEEDALSKTRHPGNSLKNVLQDPSTPHKRDNIEDSVLSLEQTSQVTNKNTWDGAPKSPAKSSDAYANLDCTTSQQTSLPSKKRLREDFQQTESIIVGSDEGKRPPKRPKIAPSQREMKAGSSGETSQVM
jgi:hypothetical protein